MKKPLTDFTEAIRFMPNSDYANYLAWNRKISSLDMKESLEDFNEAIRLKPDSAGAYCFRGIVKNRLGHMNLQFLI